LRSQAQSIIRLTWDRLLKMLQLDTVARVPAELVEGAAPGYSQQPGACPALQRYQQRILDDFLSHIEVPQDTYQCSCEPSCLFSKDSGKGGMRLGCSYWFISITGRTSTAPPAGQVLARRSASSRLATLIST
jgi:hypothetical protein